MEVEAPRGIWQQKKRKITIKRKKKKLATIFDQLFIHRPSLNICIYPNHKNNKAPKLAGDVYLESLLAEEVVTVVLNHFLLLRLHWDTSIKKKKYTQTLLLLLFVPDYFKANNEHLQKVDIHSPKSERTLNNHCLAGSFCPCPLSPLPFLYSLYLWFS